MCVCVCVCQEGVGDTPDSYAYDGNRVRKWNVTTTNYGKVRESVTGDRTLTCQRNIKNNMCISVCLLITI